MAVLYLKRFEVLTKDQRKLLVVIAILAVLQITEYLHGFLTFDVREVADSVQATLHTGALVLSFFAIDTSLQPKDVAFAYGYERVEILSAFTNNCLIIFEHTFGVLHNLHHFLVARLSGLEGHEHHDHEHYGWGQLCTMARLRLLIDMAGLALFMRQVQTMMGRALLRRRASLPPHSENMSTVGLKFVGSALTALVVAVAEVGGGRAGDMKAQMLPPLVSSICMIYLALPGLVSCGRILLLAVPRELESQLKQCRTEVGLVQGVVEVCQWNFWPFTSERSLVGVVSVKIRQEDDDNVIFQEVSSICSRICPDLTLEVVRD